MSLEGKVRRIGYRAHMIYASPEKIMEQAFFDCSLYFSLFFSYWKKMGYIEPDIL